MLLSKSKPSIYLPVIMTLWGTTTCCMSAVKNYQQLVALRVVVGILEAGFAPGVLLIISSWYKRSEQSKRFAVYISAAIMSGAFGGLLAGAITKNLEGAHGIRGWRWLFVSRLADCDMAETDPITYRLWKVLLLRAGYLYLQFENKLLNRNES